MKQEFENNVRLDRMSDSTGLNNINCMKLEFENKLSHSRQDF